MCIRDRIYNIKNMTPEEKARIKIDQWFADAGWKVVNREDYEPTSANAPIAVFPRSIFSAAERAVGERICGR